MSKSLHSPLQSHGLVSPVCWSISRGNIHCCDRNLLFTNYYTAKDIKENVCLLTFLVEECSVFLCSITQELLNICEHTIKNIVVLSAKGHKGL